MDILNQLCKFIDAQKRQSLILIEQVKSNRDFNNTDLKRHFLITEEDLKFLQTETQPEDLRKCQHAFEKIENLSKVVAASRKLSNQEFRLDLETKLQKRNQEFLELLRLMVGPDVTEEDIDLPLSEIAKKYQSKSESLGPKEEKLAWSTKTI